MKDFEASALRGEVRAETCIDPNVKKVFFYPAPGSGNPCETDYSAIRTRDMVTISRSTAVPVTRIQSCNGLNADSNGDLHGRKAGYPNWAVDNPDVAKTALHFDTVNFASHIKAPVLAGMGFIDAISPPAGVWTALNQIPGPVETLPMIESEHDNLTPMKGRACPARTKELLDVLVKGGEFKPNGTRQ
jgi:hypothetical protein